MAFIYAMIKSKSPLPNFANMEEWSKAPSTKIDALAKIAQHYLARDDAPHVFFEDGKLVVPNMPPLQPGQVITRLRRVCAYVEFIHFRPLIQQVSSGPLLDQFSCLPSIRSWISTELNFYGWTARCLSNSEET